MEIPACWSCWPVAAESSLAASYLVLVGARIQEMNLSLTPLLENKPNTVGKMRCEAKIQDASKAPHPPHPTPRPSLLLVNPQHFPLVSARNQIPPPSVTNVLNSWTFSKPYVVLFVCHVNYWSVPKPWAQLLMPEIRQNDPVNLRSKESLTMGSDPNPASYS